MEYRIGTVVRSLVDAQGLKKGETYEVLGSKTRHTFVGGFTTLTLKLGENKYEVGNPHLVLEKVV